MATDLSKTTDGIPYIGIDTDGDGIIDAIPIQINGSYPEIHDIAANKPAAAASNKSTVYWSIDTGSIEVSTGTVWRVIGWM